MPEYKITREQCQEGISGVCSHCGGEITPIETVDNARNPTFWSGCLRCSRFESGVSPKVYGIAKRLVTEYYFRAYSHLDESPDDDEETREYHQECQISGACRVVSQVLYLEKERVGNNQIPKEK